MDAERFDFLARSLSTGSSRRRVLAALSGGLLGTLAMGRLGDDAAAKKKKAQSCEAQCAKQAKPCNDHCEKKKNKKAKKTCKKQCALDKAGCKEECQSPTCEPLAGEEPCGQGCCRPLIDTGPCCKGTCCEEGLKCCGEMCCGTGWVCCADGYCEFYAQYCIDYHGGVK